MTSSNSSPGNQHDTRHIWEDAPEWLIDEIDGDDGDDGDDRDFVPADDFDVEAEDDDEWEDEEESENMDDQLEESDGHGADDEDHYTASLSATEFLRLFGSGLRQVLPTHRISGLGFYLDDNGNDVYGGPIYRMHGSRSGEHLLPKIPSDAGRKLMYSGDFGSHLNYVDKIKRRKERLATRLMWRELANGPRLRPRAISQDLIPNSKADKIIHYNSRCYSGSFSDDGNFFFSCAQDFKVRMYDTSNPLEWRWYKTVEYPFGQWTLTDASLSPDNRYLAYSSIRNIVCLAGTDPSSDSEPTLLNFASRYGSPLSGSDFGIWSIRFSGDGRELIAGTSSQSVIVYDIESRTPILTLENHDDDVNAVCFGDKSSPHILYSGSDDTTIKVWDRRSMGDGRAAGCFLGHSEGITYVDSKGDGRYVLSNGKDQSMKLWDLRKMMTSAKLDTIDLNSYSTGFDYRYMSISDADYRPHPHDCSVVTFRGHRVLKTLIRCHFSPDTSTNSKYVYSGSSDGRVFIYNLDATVAGIIDVGEASFNSRKHEQDMFRSSRRMGRAENEWATCVRDASWHPNAPIIAATSWNGWGMSTGTCSVHAWSDGAELDEAEAPIGQSYNSKLEPLQPSNRSAEESRSFTGHIIRNGRVASFITLEDDDPLDTNS
ncbi:WD repeat protein [Blastomyces dermatitidis ER-3]|uniref:WD repeat protein n=1 Tax=Ajellomyces dermatitidis (strain ER-3 / ATCC MYA-2586) TaxID=559297 RepID=A0ABP2F2S3_AJEDR|nr:WD repeat protein [Blastomyces dermatitidis ER-3]EEQ91126.2 WD repeat protein [Blastomyces dermatitidis ER-3]